MNFYVSVFKDSKILGINRYRPNAPLPEGTVLTASFELNGLRFTAFNGGPQYKFSLATFFMVDCEDQAEVDYYWDKLGEGGTYDQCAWLDDKFGVTWQDGPYFGWLSSHLKMYSETENLKTMVHIRDNGIRPDIEIEKKWTSFGL